MAEPILDAPGVVAGVGQGVAAGMAQLRWRVVQRCCTAPMGAQWRGGPRFPNGHNGDVIKTSLMTPHRTSRTPVPSIVLSLTSYPGEEECSGTSRCGQTGENKDMQKYRHDVLLLGSFAAPTGEDAFRTISGILGDRIKRIPDGETGERTQWIRWQVFAFRDNPSFEMDPYLKGSDYPTDFYILRPGTAAKNVTFKSLGYADNAIASHAVLTRLKFEGVVRQECRLQVSLPTPYNVLDRHVAPKDRLAVECPYEQRMLAEIEEMAAAIPPKDLAIQWDCAHEITNLDGARKGWFENLHDEEHEILDRLVRLGNHIPNGVELGYHFCYGDFNHQHVIEPKDAGLMVRVANKLSRQAGRSIQWIHMPVPRGRLDDAYYAPLKDLRLRTETELYLGLVHYTDGSAGTRKRMQVAKKFVQSFGIATECGLGRRAPETMPQLLRIHAEAANIADN